MLLIYESGRYAYEQDTKVLQVEQLRFPSALVIKQLGLIMVLA